MFGFNRALTTVTVAGFLLVGVAVATPAEASTPPAVSIYSSSCGTLYEGENDGCVTDLQEILNDLGFGLDVDGDFGNNTLAAVNWVQAKAHLTDSSVSVDGQVGPVTKSKLNAFDHHYYDLLGVGCALVLQPHPGSGSADALISESGGSGNYCTGALYRSNNGGASWSQVSGSHTVSSGSVQTYNYSDTAGQLAEVCGDGSYPGGDDAGCTIGF